MEQGKCIPMSLIKKKQWSIHVAKFVSDYQHDFIFRPLNLWLPLLCMCVCVYVSACVFERLVSKAEWWKKYWAKKYWTYFVAKHHQTQIIITKDDFICFKTRLKGIFKFIIELQNQLPRPANLLYVSKHSFIWLFKMILFLYCIFCCFF